MSVLEVQSNLVMTSWKGLNILCRYNVTVNSDELIVNWCHRISDAIDKVSHKLSLWQGLTLFVYQNPDLCCKMPMFVHRFATWRNEASVTVSNRSGIAAVPLCCHLWIVSYIEQTRCQFYYILYEWYCIMISILMIKNAKLLCFYLLCCFLHFSIYPSGFMTAVAFFRKPNTTPPCFSVDLVLNFLLSWLLVLLPSMFPAFLLTLYQIHSLYYWLNGSCEQWVV